MKALKIENGQGFYRSENGDYKAVDYLDKEALLILVNCALEDEFEFDEYNESLLKNQAHQIIYRSISEKLLDLNSRRVQFRDEADNLFVEEYNKYKP